MEKGLSIFLSYHTYKIVAITILTYKSYYDFTYKKLALLTKINIVSILWEI